MGRGGGLQGAAVDRRAAEGETDERRRPHGEAYAQPRAREDGGRLIKELANGLCDPRSMREQGVYHRILQDGGRRRPRLAYRLDGGGPPGSVAVCERLARL